MSVEHFEGIVDCIGIPIFVKDGDHRFVFVNDAACEMLSIPRDQWSGKTDYDLFPEKQADIFRKRDLYVRETGDKDVNEEQITDSLGKVRTIVTTKTLYVSETGEKHVVGTIQDITDRKNLEDTARKAEAIYRTIFENAGVGIYQSSMQGRLVSVNPALTRMLGFGSPKELIEFVTDTAAQLYVDPLDFTRIRELCSEQGFVDGYETQLRRKDKRPAWVSINMRFVKDEGDNIVFLEGTVEDIDERKHAEDALRESRQQYRDLVESTSDWIWEVDQNASYTYASPKIRDILGYEPGEAIGKTPFDFMEHDEGKRVNRIFSSITESRGPIQALENIVLHKSGRKVVLETSGVPIFDDKGGFRGYRGIDRDITERKRAEEALRESEEKYRTLVEQADDGIIVVQNAILKYVNQAMADLLDSSVELLTGSPIADHIDDRQVERITALHRNRLAGEKLPSRYEALLRHHDGSPIQTELNVGVIRYHGELATQVTVRDITERKRAEEALRWSEELYRTLIAASPDPITVTDLSGRITLGSRKALELFRVPEGMGIGHSILDWVETKDRSRAEEAMRQLLTTGRFLVGEFVLRRNDGTCFNAEVHAAPIGSCNDVAQGAIFITRDVTERKRMEGEIIESRERLRSLADHLSTVREDEKAKIARELHDELGQSLTAVLIGLSLLCKKLRKDQRALAVGVDALKTTVRSTIEAIKRIQGELRPWMLDTLGLCATMDWQAKYFTELTHIPVTFEWNHETAVDQKLSVALFRIFQEALSNAARHAEATKIKVELVQDDKEVRLTVSDNGRGIEKHEIHKPFSFGLLGIRERIEAFSGSFDIDGSRGKGTRLTVRLPRTKP